jgi:hypothetical protein
LGVEIEEVVVVVAEAVTEQPVTVEHETTVDVVVVLPLTSMLNVVAQSVTVDVEHDDVDVDVP